MIIRLLKPAQLFDGEMLREGALVVIEEAVGEDLVNSGLAIGPLSDKDTGDEVPFILTPATIDDIPKEQIH